jgi:hypothetical protein
VWAKSHGGLPLDLAGNLARTVDGDLCLPTYKFGRTEIAWRAWANRPARPAAADTAGLPPGLTFDGYHDSDDHYGKTILDLVRSRLEVDPDDLAEGDVLYVNAAWVQPQEWRVVRSGNPMEVERISPPAAVPPQDRAAATSAARLKGDES